MKLYGSTKIYGITLMDLKENKTYNITGTVRDLYQTFTESGGEVKILLPSRLMGQDTLAQVDSIIKSDHSGSVYQIKDEFDDINESLTGLDRSLYCDGDTIICPPGGYPKAVRFFIPSNRVKVIKFEIENPDFYEFSLSYKDDIYKVTNLCINSILVILKDNEKSGSENP